MLEVHLDPVGGIAGNMFVAALLDLRPDLETPLIDALSLCPLIVNVSIGLESHNDGILTGRRLTVHRNGQRAEDLPKRVHHDNHTHADWHLIREALLTSKLDSDKRQRLRRSVRRFKDSARDVRQPAV